VTYPEPASAADLQRAMDALVTSRRPNPPRVELVSTVRADVPGAVVVEVHAYLGQKYVGWLELTRADDDDVERECRAAVAFMRRRHSGEGDPLGLLVVSSSGVELDARNTGVGVALYAEAAALARRRFGSLMIAHECVGGQTSTKAERVWESDRFRQSADVFRRVAYGR